MPKTVGAAIVLLVALALQASTGTGASTAPALATTTMEIKGTRFTLEVADTEKTRQRGLMFREKLGKDEGMVFVMEQEGYWPFWMKNTLIDLDGIWVNSKGEVVHIATMRAKDETPVGGSVPASVIIELGAGRARELGLKVGDRLALPKGLKAKADAATEPGTGG